METLCKNTNEKGREKQRGKQKNALSGTYALVSNKRFKETPGGERGPMDQSDCPEIGCTFPKVLRIRFTPAFALRLSAEGGCKSTEKRKARCSASRQERPTSGLIYSNQPTKNDFRKLPEKRENESARNCERKKEHLVGCSMWRRQDPNPAVQSTVFV